MPASKLPPSALRWRCEPSALGFSSTRELVPYEGIGGQDEARDTLRFGLEFDAPGQHVFVRGIRGTGRLTMVQHVLERAQRSVSPAPDRCYVRNFGQPERPRLITLSRGQADAFRQTIEDLVRWIGSELAPALKSDDLHRAAALLDKNAQQQMRALTDPLDADLAAAGLALMMAQIGESTRPVIVPVVEGKPLPPDELASVLERGALTPEQLEERLATAEQFAPRVQAINERALEIKRARSESFQQRLQQDARRLLGTECARLQVRFAGADVAAFLDELVDDVVGRRLADLDSLSEFEHLYRVNVLVTQRTDAPGGRIVESAPSIHSLLGSIEPPGEGESAGGDAHMWVHAGSLLRADGGYLVLDARDVLSEPGAWPVLVRTLRTGRLEFSVPDPRAVFSGPGLQPEPIPLDVKVVLIGEPEIYFALDSADPDFPQLFKVLVDFDTVIARDQGGVDLYSRVLARMVAEERLPAFAAEAVAAVAEHGARIAARRGKLTARLARIGDIAREAAFLARQRGAQDVEAQDVRETVRRTKHRADLPARRFRESVADGSIRIETRGLALGQINGLAVIHAGPLTYGFPIRMSAAAGPGSGGAVNIEGQAQLSGAIHTKSHYILGGLLRRLLALEHPLVFDASIAVEQSYGGIDGDSASAAAICCLLSALTSQPVRQDLAMTGAIDQLGNVLPIGAVNEKIEGFFDTCASAGLTGTQGVIIPAANVGDLMLREDVVEACAAGRFCVHAVDHIRDALELFFERPPGELDADGRYPEHSVLRAAVDRAHAFWQVAGRPVAR